MGFSKMLELLQEKNKGYILLIAYLNFEGAYEELKIDDEK